MKKVFVLAAALMLFAAPAMAAISGSAHDFSSIGTSGEICVYCHTPHGADSTVTDAPLWNHTVTGETFTLYSSSTLDGSVGIGATPQPAGRSKLCLSCHDGVTNVDAYGGAGGSGNISTAAFAGLSAADGNIGTDLSNDHPVTVSYVAGASGDAYLNSNTGFTVGSLPLYDSAGDGTTPYVECASCHEVHNESGNTNLLRVDNASSALCLVCHNK